MAERHTMRTGPAPGATALADAARAITSVASVGQSSEKALAVFQSSPDRAAIRAITLGSLRWYLRLAPALGLLIDRPDNVMPDIRALLVASAHQIEYSRNAPQLTVHLAVDAARILGRDGATGLVNAVLRRFVSERGVLLARIDEDLAARTAHPAWLVDAISRAWPKQAPMILEAGNKHPPLILRVDLTRSSVPQYVAALSRIGTTAHALAWASAGVQLAQAVPVSALPGFAEGVVSVQDAGAQLAAVLLDAQPGMRVLDACAAPGGKTGHLLEHTADLAELVAVDIDAARCARIKDNLDRLSRTATLVVADIRYPQGFWDGAAFDRILVDAPCSSTGVIRRHPDIKLLRRHEDIAEMARLQLEILHACFGLLAANGRLLYCTCSVLPAENEELIARFLKSEPHARPGSMRALGELPPGAQMRVVGVQLLPGAEAGTDGFYYACLEKTAVGTLRRRA
jgi:16S rRNA (cytosine967-C5)-methyltransferase